MSLNANHFQLNSTYIESFHISRNISGFFFNGALSSGHFASYLDLSPNFSGTIFGISNTFSGGGIGFIVPLIIGALTQVFSRT